MNAELGAISAVAATSATSNSAMQRSTSSNNKNRKKSKSPRSARRRNRSRSFEAMRFVEQEIAHAAACGNDGGQQQQNNVPNRRATNAKHIKFSINSSSTTVSPNNRLQRSGSLRNNVGFIPGRRERSNSESSSVRNRSSQRITNPVQSFKPGMSNDFVSREIMEYYQRNRQSNDKYKAKQILRQSLENTLKQSFPTYFINLHIIGSTTNGIGDNASTVDICVLARKKPVVNEPKATTDDTEKDVKPEMSENRDESEKPNNEPVIALADSNTLPLDKNEELNLKHIEQVLQNKNFAKNIILIPARVPVIKFDDIICNLNVTLNLNQDVSIRNTHLIRDYSKMDWRFPQLAMIVKEWARENRINSAVDKSISPYSWTLMVIHYLQVVEPPVLPCLQKMVPQRYDVNNTIEEEINCWRQHPIKWQSKNTNTLKQLLKGLFRYFGYVFDYDQHLISVREGKVLNRIYCQSNRSTNGSYDDNSIQWNALMCVEEPFNRSNTTRSVHEHETFERIQELLRMSSNALKGNGISLFNIIVNDLDFPKNKN